MSNDGGLRTGQVFGACASAGPESLQRRITAVSPYHVAYQVLSRGDLPHDGHTTPSRFRQWIARSAAVLQTGSHA